MTDYKESIEAAAWVGRQQAFAVVASHSSAAQAACLKEMRDSRFFEKLSVSWDQFCEEYIGFSRMQADRLISQYDEFGQTYFRLSQLARISPSTYRQIEGKIKDDVLEFEDEKIPLTPNNVPKIRAALKKLRAGLRAARADAKERPSLSRREFEQRFDVFSSELHAGACMCTTAAELETYRGMCAYGRKRWEYLTDTINRINRT
jgi:hypothetical protein